MVDLPALKTNMAASVRSAIVGLNAALSKAVYSYEPFLTEESVAITMMVFGFSRNHAQPAKEYNIQLIVKIPIGTQIDKLQVVSDDLLKVVDTGLRLDPTFSMAADHSYVDSAEVSVEGEKPIIKQIWSIRAVEYERGIGR